MWVNWILNLIPGQKINKYVVLWSTKPLYSNAIVGKFQHRFSVLRTVEREREGGGGGNNE